MKRRWWTLLLVILLLAAGGVTVWWIQKGPRTTGDLAQAQSLYTENCAVCHGPSGDGKGEAAYLLQPKPRNFRAGQFRLVTSQNLAPTRDDVYRTVSNGMPGTAMPSWMQLAEPDRWALADYVLKLYRDGWYEKGLGLGYPPAEAEKYAAEMTAPGAPVSIPPEPPLTPAGLKQGAELYRAACANCHGENGEGRRDPTWRTAEGFPTWSRNLRQGVFKSGRSGEQLYLMFSTGLPGTPMPQQTFTPEQTWRVVQYVLSLSSPAAQEAAQVRQAEINARRVAKLPGGAEDAAWERVPEVRIPLMPLWWNEQSIGTVRVRAAHDGERLAFLLEWEDATRDAEAIRQKSFPDGAAVQFSAQTNPPLFAMGAPGQQVNIWHWKALWSEDRRQFQDVASVFPNLAVNAYFGSQKGWKSEPLEDKQFRPAQAAQNLIAHAERPSIVEDANATGLGTLTSQPAEQQSVEGVSVWKNGVWRLQLTRLFQSGDGGDVRLGPGQRVSAAFAIWNGSAGDRNGQKNVSIWNALRLE